MNTSAEIFASDVETVEFWLSPENTKALEQLRAKQPELGQFVDRIRSMVDDKMKLMQKAEQTKEAAMT